MNHEKQPIQGHENHHSKNLEDIAEKRKQEIHEQLEKRSHEKGNESLEEARLETEEVFSKREKTQEKDKRVGERENLPEKRGAIVGKEEREKSYTRIMSETRSHMSPASRSFSKVIHNPAVERVSDAAGKTVARPNAILSGSVSAFIIVLAVYLLAKHYGYPLSGTETMVAFTAGWLLGLVYDYFKAMYTGGRGI